MTNQIEIYKSSDGTTQIDVQFGQETVWLDQNHLSTLFDTDRTSILKHIQNVYTSKELDEVSTCAKIAQVRVEGKRSVKREILHYNLDVIISVGYRVNSVKGTQFRQWATQRLKEYLVQGYAINEKRLAQKQQEVQYLRTGIQILSRVIEQKSSEMELVWLNQFAGGLALLDDYDHDELDQKGYNQQKAEFPKVEEYQEIIDGMKTEFGSSVFGKMKDESFYSSINQISKGFGERDFYPSLEEKAAMLLYLIVKNHAFVDGNKRIAAACFLLFLQRNKLLQNKHGKPIISNDALAGLTLFVASSKPEEMETVKRLVVSVLNRNQ
ncbi:MAG: virulence protein RhuM/Fic/DOC family protein [Flavobacteriales bacterium]|nr:virulence protein RhuM/Fic/DOC family protein [Flavobacteriales bacterium]